MIKNMKIRNFLILSFAIVLILMNGLGFMSIHFMRRLANQTIEFYEKPHTVQMQVEGVRQDMSNIDNKIKEAIIDKTVSKTNETTDFIATTLETMDQRIAIVKEKNIEDESLLNTADQKMETWLAENSKIKAAMEKEDYDAALKIFNDSYLPAKTAVMDAVKAISDDAQVRIEEYYSTAKRSKVISTFVILATNGVTIVVTILLCYLIIRSIVTPLTQLKSAAHAMKKGNLKYNIEFTGKNEFGLLADYLRSTMQTLSVYVQNIDDNLGKIADNDLTGKVEIEYIGDFVHIKDSIENIIEFLKMTVSHINDASDQVGNGAQQVSNSSQILSQGAAEQASSVEKLTMNLNDIFNQVKDTTKNTEDVNQLVETVGNELEEGNQHMDLMLEAIKEMNSAADEIAKIIKTIEDIAFQTNILALNAAVEAARAGTAGKGFAVVADEVRNLAAKSGEAAKSTTELIENSIHAVEKGTKIADETAKKLRAVVEGAHSISSRVAQIASSSEAQVSYLGETTEGVNQLNQVIQSNSATSEESAAISEELNGQAAMLKEFIAQFKTN